MSNSHQYILKKKQNTAKVGTLASNKLVPSIKDVLDKKNVNVSVWKVICTTS